MAKFLQSVLGRNAAIRDRVNANVTDVSTGAAKAGGTAYGRAGGGAVVNNKYRGVYVTDQQRQSLYDNAETMSEEAQLSYIDNKRGDFKQQAWELADDRKSGGSATRQDVKVAKKTAKRLDSLHSNLSKKRGK
jgi:hypothetical protein